MNTHRVEMSTQLIEQLRDGWSVPIEVRVILGAQGGLLLDCREPVNRPPSVWTRPPKRRPTRVPDAIVKHGHLQVVHDDPTIFLDADDTVIDATIRFE